MNKTIKTLLILGIPLVLLILAISYFGDFFLDGEIFESNEFELAKIKDEKSGATYRVTSFAGNATVSNTLKLYEIKNGKERFLQAIETFIRYDENIENYHANDSTIFMLLTQKGANEIDTFQLITLPGKAYLRLKGRS